MPESIERIVVRTLEGRVSEELLRKQQKQPDNLAWAAVGLHVHGGDSELVQSLQQELADLQQPDGSVPLIPEFKQAWWPTSLALLAWRLYPEFTDQRKLAVDFLLNNRGIAFKRIPEIIGHDTTIQGWPWTGETHSWVEPTALVLIALASEGVRDHPVVLEAVELIKDRRLPDGGWNYGNTRVYQSELLPSPEGTGMALCAIRDTFPKQDVLTSISYLEDEYLELRTPLSLSWTIMGLAAYGHRPADYQAKVAEALSLQERYGNFSLAQIGMLAACLSDFPFELKGGD